MFLRDGVVRRFTFPDGSWSKASLISTVALS